MNIQFKQLRSLQTGICAAIISVLLFSPIVFALAGTAYDFLAHRDLAGLLIGKHVIASSRFFLQIAVAGIYTITGSLDLSMATVMLLAYAATGAIIAHDLQTVVSSRAMVCALAVSLLFASAIAVLFPLDGHLYFGYISPNVFHNPTITLLRPFALLSFLFATTAVSGEDVSSTRSLIICAFLTLACAMTKPSFTVCIVPALALHASLRYLLHLKSDWKRILFGFVVPASVSLVMLYWMTYSESQLTGADNNKSGVIIAPFVVMKYYSSWIGIKFLLSILYPFSVLALFFRTAMRDSSMQLAWLLFIVGAGYTYIMAESGPRMMHGNFTWSGQITLFLLFVQTTRFLCGSYKAYSESDAKQSRTKFIICLLFLLTHVIFGAIFYGAEYIQTEKYW